MPIASDSRSPAARASMPASLRAALTALGTARARARRAERPIVRLFSRAGRTTFALPVPWETTVSTAGGASASGGGPPEAKATTATAPAAASAPSRAAGTERIPLIRAARCGRSPARVSVDYSQLADRAPVGGAPADRRALELCAVARAGAAAAARLHEAARVDAALADGVAGGGAQLPAQVVELVGAQLARHAPRGEPRAPERLVGEQVADTGDRALIEQLGLQGDAASADVRTEHVPADLGRVGAHVGEVGLDHGPPEPPLVAQRQPPAVGEVEHEAVPAVLRGLLVDRDPPRHPEVQAEVGAAVVGLGPEELPAPVRRRQPPPDQRRRDLARRVRAAHVSVRVVDSDDLAVQRPLDLLARALCLRKLGHV